MRAAHAGMTRGSDIDLILFKQPMLEIVKLSTHLYEASVSYVTEEKLGLHRGFNFHMGAR